MELSEDIKKLIADGKNICVIPPESSGPESLASALALFYTLKELGKNVNLIMPQLPDKLGFLTPSLDFISQPKNFVISIPRNIADISQVYYEKNEENLKIHLTINKGQIKKEQVSFYFSDAKPDAIITVGVKDFKKELDGKLDSFGFLLDSPIINIDDSPENQRFGQYNIVEEKSLPQITLEFVQSFGENTMNKHVANCLLTGLTLHYENFQNADVAPELFELCAYLMKKGADRQLILSNLYGPKIQAQSPMSAVNNPVV